MHILVTILRIDFECFNTKQNLTIPLTMFRKKSTFPLKKWLIK